MNRLLPSFVKRPDFLLLPVLAMTSCAGSPQSKSLAHLFQERSRLHSVTMRNFPNQPQARLVVTDNKTKRTWASHKTMKEGEFEAMWGMFDPKDLGRFYIPKPGSGKVDLNDSYVFFTGDVSKPGDAKMYIIPDSQAPQPVKTLAQAMRNYGRPPGKEAAR